MNDTKDLIREIQEHIGLNGIEDTATHLLVQAAAALQRQADEQAAIGAGGVSGPLLGGTLRTQAQPVGDDLRAAAQAVVDRWDTPLWKDVPATAEYIGRLRAALAAQAPQQAAPAVASKAVLTAIRDANLQLVRTGEDTFMLVTLKQAAPLQEVQYDHGPQAEAVAEAARDVGKWLNERPNRPLDLRHVAMLAHHATAQPAPSGDASLPPSYLGSVLSSSLHGNSVTFQFGDRDEAERWHDAVADAWDAARKEGK